jgi:hypothetical protein
MVWAVSLLSTKLISRTLTGSWNPCQIFGVCHDLVPLSQPAPKQLLYPLTGHHCRCASTHFGEIQLALNSIGISPLITAHPPIFQHRWVRSSIRYYPNFNLAMIRSSRFGSIRSDVRPIQTRFRLGSRICTLNLATSYKSPAHSSTGTRSESFSSHCLSAYDFMFYFTPLRGFSFTFPSLYFFTIGHSGVFSLTRWSSLIHTGFHVPHATRDIQKKGEGFDYWTFTIFGAGFSCFVSSFFSFLTVHHPLCPGIRQSRPHRRDFVLRAAVRRTPST